MIFFSVSKRQPPIVIDRVHGINQPNYFNVKVLVFKKKRFSIFLMYKILETSVVEEDVNGN